MRLFFTLALALTLASGMQAQRRLAYTAKTADKVDFEIYNNINKGGFSIVAPKEVFGEEVVLGYADSGSFDYDNAPENLKWWLSEYQRQIEYAKTHDLNFVQSPESRVQRSSLNSSVEPLLTSHWTQRIPYNTKCPMVNDSWCMVGCLATAMAQVMYFWKYPEKGTGKHSYVYNGETISSNFGEHTYNWEIMQDEYIGSYSMESADAVAQLCFDCGVSIDMAYRTTASGAYADDVPNALKTYFGYNKFLSIRYRDNYKQQSTWDDLVKKELDAGRPVIYGGSNQAGNSGHAFVCDGYREDGYFHFNFGFGNGYDGYFLLSTINPAGNDFSYLQDAFTGVKPQANDINGVEVNGQKSTVNNFYNLAGQKVGAEYRGIVISEGKKILRH